MRRWTSALVLFGAAASFLIWQAAPATSSPKNLPPAFATSIEQSGAVVADVDTQVEQLRRRLDTVPQYPEPSRDPFNFGRRPEPKSVAPPATPPVVVEEPPLALPELVAIVGDEKTERRAVLAAGEDVKFVKVGDATGVFVVQRLTADAMVVVDQTTGKSYTISLR